MIHSGYYFIYLSYSPPNIYVPPTLFSLLFLSHSCPSVFLLLPTELNQGVLHSHRFELSIEAWWANLRSYK